MKSKMLYVLLAAVMMVSLCPMFTPTALAAVADEADFEFDANEKAITKYVGSGGDVIIPDTIGGVAVETIGWRAFMENETLTSVTIPQGVTEISNQAFKGCKNLANASIPKSATNIGEMVFEGCEKLISVNLPDGLTSISKSLFYGCSSLVSLKIPDNVDSIGANAFYGCSSLKNIEIPSKVSIITQNMFGECTSLLSLKLSNNITQIGQTAFYKCTSMKTLVLGTGVNLVYENAFLGCSNLTIYVPNESVKYKAQGSGVPSERIIIGGGDSYISVDGTVSLGDGGDTHINLTKETIKLPFDVAAYSTDGGKKWKKGGLPSDTAKFSKLFDKDLTLWVASEYNVKDVKEDKNVVAKKGVPSTAMVVKFPKIEKRPKANSEKLAPFYSDDNPTKWVLSKKGSTTYTDPTGTYEWAETSNGKTAEGEWQAVPADGYAIAEPGTKATYLFRSVATADEGKYTPGSKVFKVKPAAFQKTPKYKAPVEKKGAAVLKLKKGDFCKVGDKIYGSLTATTTLNIVYDVKDNSKEILGGSTVTIWKAATGKKPRSLEQSDLGMPAMSAPESTNAEAAPVRQPAVDELATLDMMEPEETPES